MRDVSDAFLLQMAEVAAGLVGLFLIGVFFYVEAGLRRSAYALEVFQPYLLASTKIVLLLFAIPIFLSLTLVVMEPVWSRLLFGFLSLLLIATNVETALRIREFERVAHSTVFVLTEVVGTLAVIALVLIPWLLGGLEPTREDLAWAILLSFATGFLGIWAIVLSAFQFEKGKAIATTNQRRRRVRRRRVRAAPP
jgi:hypothetical protein